MTRQTGERNHADGGRPFPGDVKRESPTCSRRNSAAGPRQDKLTAAGRAASRVAGAASRLVWRAFSSLGVWIMPIVVGALMAVALNGTLNFRMGSGPDPDHDRIAIDGEQPIFFVDLYYSGEYVKVVRSAHQQGDDILASALTFESAWNAASPAMPLTIKFVSSPHSEPVAENSARHRTFTTTAVVDETNFQELRPILDDIRNLILEGDGSGCGRLNRSGYQAQPANAAKILSGVPRDTGRGPMSGGPAKVAPRPNAKL